MSLEEEYSSRREELLKNYNEVQQHYKELDIAAAQDRLKTNAEAVAKAQDEYTCGFHQGF